MRDILSDLDPKGEVEKNPMRDVQKQTSLPKKFYDAVTISDDDGNGFCVLLDGRAVKTPAKNTLKLPEKGVAEKVAAEWLAQSERIDPAKMPMTRMANTAIDGVRQNPDAVFDEIVRFSGTDLLFYRAQAPQKLIDLQTKHWDCVLNWASNHLGAQFRLTEGVMHIEQPQTSIEAFAEALARYRSPFQLTGLHSATTIMGSALLALAFAEGEISLDDAWQAAHVDEDWNISQWGEDHEAKERRAFRYRDFEAACTMIKL